MGIYPTFPILYSFGRVIANRKLEFRESRAPRSACAVGSIFLQTADYVLFLKFRRPFLLWRRDSVQRRRRTGARVSLCRLEIERLWRFSRKKASCFLRCREEYVKIVVVEDWILTQDLAFVEVGAAPLLFLFVVRFIWEILLE